MYLLDRAKTQPNPRQYKTCIIKNVFEKQNDGSYKLNLQNGKIQEYVIPWLRQAMKSRAGMEFIKVNKKAEEMLA